MVVTDPTNRFNLHHFGHVTFFCNNQVSTSHESLVWSSKLQTLVYSTDGIGTRLNFAHSHDIVWNIASNGVNITSTPSLKQRSNIECSTINLTV